MGPFQILGGKNYFYAENNSKWDTNQRKNSQKILSYVLAVLQPK